jgi:hypothetical protein
MQEINTPKHIDVFLEKYASKKIPPSDVSVDFAPDLADTNFNISLPTFDSYGRPYGLHNFRLSLRSVIEEKTKLIEELNATIEKLDAVVGSYNTLVAVLQEILDTKPRPKLPDQDPETVLTPKNK